MCRECRLSGGVLGYTNSSGGRYDKLVIACGSVSSTHGVPGLESCFQLKTISDAQAIRRRIISERDIRQKWAP